jgi:hypothetical protein
MPFDDTTTRRAPHVTILPPTPPEHGKGPPQRIHIEIELVDRRQSPPGGYGLGVFAFWLFVLFALAALAHAQTPQPDQRWHYQHFQGLGGWHGETRSQGTTSDFDAYGPGGQHRHCHRYYVGDQPITTCQ